MYAMKKFCKLNEHGFLFHNDQFSSVIKKLEENEGTGWSVKVWRKSGDRMYLIDTAIYPSVHLCKNFAWETIHDELSLMLRDWSGIKFKNEFVQDHDDI